MLAPKYIIMLSQTVNRVNYINVVCMVSDFSFFKPSQVSMLSVAQCKKVCIQIESVNAAEIPLVRGRVSCHSTFFL